MSLEKTNIDVRLKYAWVRECCFHHLRGVAFLVPWIIGVFLADLFLDWLLDLPGYLRVVLLLANVGILGWVSWDRWIKNLRRYDATRVSLQVERLHPALNNLLVSYVQFDADSKETHGSRSMIEVVRAQAMKAVNPLDFRGIVNFMTLRNLFLFSTVALVLFAVSSIFAGNFYLVALGRMLNPFTSLTYPTQTHIDEVTIARTNPEGQSETIVVSGERAAAVALKQGDRPEIAASVSGTVPEFGSLFVKYEKASWEEFSIAVQGGSRLTQQMTEAKKDFQYYFRIGDTRSKVFDAKIVGPPHLTSAKVSFTFPSYLGLKNKEFDRLQVDAAPEGTDVTWRLRCDQPLKGGRILFADSANKPVNLEIDPTDRHQATATINIANYLPLVEKSSQRTYAELVYSFEWTEDNHGFTFQDGTRHSIRVVPDNAPNVTVRKPAREWIKATTKKKLYVEFDVSDDYGLGKAWISYTINKQNEVHRLYIGTFDGGTRSDRRFTEWKIKDALPNLKEGDIVTFHVEATDNRAGTAGPANVGRSQPVQLEFVSEAAYQQFVHSEVVSGLNNTKKAAQEELNSSKKIRALIPEK